MDRARDTSLHSRSCRSVAPPGALATNHSSGRRHGLVARIKMVVDRPRALALIVVRGYRAFGAIQVCVHTIFSRFVFMYRVGQKCGVETSAHVRAFRLELIWLGGGG